MADKKKVLEQTSLISATSDQPPPPPPPPSKQPKEKSPKSSSEQSQTDHKSQTPKIPPQPTLSNPKSSSSSSFEEDDDDDESETDAEIDSEYEPTSKIVSPKSKPSTGTKRVAHSKPEHSKKMKPTTSVVVAVAAGDNKKTNLFQRLFTENDECAILEGIIIFSAETGNDPLKNYPAFYLFVKKFVHFDVTLNQLKDKVCKLKKKFMNKMEKGNVNNFSKPMERKIFELCKKIWGVKLEKGKGKSTMKESTTRKLLIEPYSDEKEDPCSTLLVNEMMRFNKSVDVSGLDLDVAKRGVKLIGESKRGELQEMWKELQMEEVELVVKRAKLVEYQARLMFDALKLSSSH